MICHCCHRVQARVHVTWRADLLLARARDAPDGLGAPQEAPELCVVFGTRVGGMPRWIHASTSTHTQTHAPTLLVQAQRAPQPAQHALGRCGGGGVAGQLFERVFTWGVCQYLMTNRQGVRDGRRDARLRTSRNHSDWRWRRPSSFTTPSTAPTPAAASGRSQARRKLRRPGGMFVVYVGAFCRVSDVICTSFEERVGY